jgi:uncharacterized protein involved in exopolysaccharide biosynthesis
MVSFSPQVTGASALRGLAAQFGLDPAGSDPGQSPDFYQELIRSDRLLSAVAESNYRLDGDAPGTNRNLAALLDISGRNGDVLRDKTIRKLRELLTVTSSRRSGLVSIRVSAPYPELAQQLGQATLEAINDFNQRLRKTRSGAERRFIESRLLEARAELSSAEDALQRFVKANRSLLASPELQLERDRLAREVSIRQSVALGLAQAFEQARIDEVRDTPLITVVQPPIRPVRPEWRPVLTITLAFSVALLLAVSWHVLLQSYESALRDDPAAADEVRRLLRWVRGFLAIRKSS